MSLGDFRHPAQDAGSALPRVRSRPWSEVVEFYRVLVENHHLPFGPMLGFIKQLAASKLAGELYPHTSMHDLVLHSQPEAVMRDHSLVVRFNSEKREFAFLYHRSPAGIDGMEKIVKEPESWATLLVFLRYKYGIHLPDA